MNDPVNLTTSVDCGSKTYFFNDTAVTTLLEISEITFAVTSWSPLVVSIIFLAIIAIGVLRKLYIWQEFVMAANRSIADIIFALAMIIHFQTRSVNDTISPGFIKHMLTMPGSSLIEPKWLHFLFTFDFLMVLAVPSFSCIFSAYAMKQPTSYDQKLTSFFLVKVSCLMWIAIGGISFLITIPDHHNTLAEKMLHHLTQPNPDGSLLQIALFCDQFDKDEISLVDDTTAALAVPLLCYLILGSSLFALIAVLWKNRVRTRHFFEISSVASRMCIHVGMYFIFLAFYLYAFYRTSNAREACIGSKNICELLADVPLIRKYIYASMIATVIWLIRMIVDPVVDLVSDKRLRKALQRRATQFDDLVEMMEHDQDDIEVNEN